MKATTLLATHHRTVLQLLTKLQLGAQGSGAILATLAVDLPAHLALEQEIFYPAVGHIDPDLVAEGIEEHALVELALERLLATDTDDPSFAGRARAVHDVLARHVEEEEDRLFPLVEESLEPYELDDLGELMAERYEQLVCAAVVPAGLGAVSTGAALAPC